MLNCVDDTEPVCVCVRGIEKDVPWNPIERLGRFLDAYLAQL
jgi:hypothetical protein